MEITKEQLFRYFRGQASEDDEVMIDSWLAEDEKNRRFYREAHTEFDLLVMTGDMSSVRGTAPARKSAKRINAGAKVVIGVAAAVAFFFIASWTAEYRLDRKIEENPFTVTVPAGQQMTMTLADGTSVNLNSGAKLIYPVIFKGKERSVYLEGEAVFDVTHDASRPFTVNTYAAQVEVLGTTFNVIADSRENEFSATLIEGKVKVSQNGDGNTVTLCPDQRVSMRGGRLYVEDVEAQESMAWTEGILDISDMSFDRLMRKMENAYGVKIIVERNPMPELRGIKGRLRMSEGIDHAMTVISQLTDFTYEKDTRTGTIYIR